jgi:hypothetical protein
VIGIDVASSAQLKHRGTGIEHGDTELRGGGTGDRGHKTVAARGSDASAAVTNGGGHETDHLWGVWGKLGGWNRDRGCSGGVFRRSRAAARGSEQGRVGG